MKALIIVFACFSWTLSAQYTYWTYDGAEAFPEAYVWSIKGTVEDDTVFRTIGSFLDSGMRGYQGTFKLSDGSRITGETSEYFDYCYPAAGGFLPQSFIPMPDGGYITMRAEVLPSGWDWPRYIRFDANLDTLWVKANLPFNDPDGPSITNSAVFIAPIDEDRFLSVCFVPGLEYRFTTHSVHTGEVLTNGLWDRFEISTEEEEYIASIQGGMLTEYDSVFVWGGYYHYVPDIRYQLFYAKFDLLGNLGSYYLSDPDDINLVGDKEGEALLEGDVLTMFYSDAIATQGFIDDAFTCQLKARRLQSSDLSLIEEVHIPFPPVDGVYIYDFAFGNIESALDGGYLATSYIRPYEDSLIFFAMKMNAALELEWYTQLLPQLANQWGNYLLNECLDRSIVVGGFYYPTIFDLPREYFIKLDACGYMVPSDCPEFVSVADGEIRQEGFRLWPNPGTGAVDAIVPFNARRLQVVDASGRCVYTEDLYYPRQTWQLTHLPNGVYTFIVHTEDGRKHHQRWVKQ
jgi:hypothetical protein